MFLCEECATGELIDSFWFQIGMLSRGKCEGCGKIASCLDVPSKALPKKQESNIDKIRRLEAENAELRSMVKGLLAECENINDLLGPNIDAPMIDEQIMNKAHALIARKEGSDEPHI